MSNYRTKKDYKALYEYTLDRLVLSNNILEMIKLAINSKFEDKYLARYLKEIEPHITQTIDDDYHQNKWKEKMLKKWEVLNG